MPLPAGQVISDPGGNVIALIDPTAANDVDKVVASFDYTPYGSPAIEDNPTGVFCPFRFSTKYLDHEIGLYYYGYRYYDPTSGTWLNRDPIAEQGGLNLYAFCGNDPVNRIDPFGLESADLLEEDHKTTGETDTGGLNIASKGFVQAVANKVFGIIPIVFWRDTTSDMVVRGVSAYAESRIRNELREQNDEQARKTEINAARKGAKNCYAPQRTILMVDSIFNPLEFETRTLPTKDDIEKDEERIAKAGSLVTMAPIIGPIVEYALSADGYDAAGQPIDDIDRAALLWDAGIDLSLMLAPVVRSKISPKISPKIVWQPKWQLIKGGGKYTIRNGQIPRNGVPTSVTGQLDNAYHYTSSQWADSIQRTGLRPGSYATPNGNLTGLQAQLELSLNPTRAAPDMRIRIDLDAMRSSGYKIPTPTRVSNVVIDPVTGRVYTMPGGGSELQFPYEVPNEFLEVPSP